MERNPCGIVRPSPPPANQFEAELEQCSTLPKALRRCPEGNKAEKVCPIYPQPNVFPRNNQQGQWITTYQNDFIVLKSGRPRLAKPCAAPWRTERQYEYDSVYRADYVPFCPEKRKQKERIFEYAPPCIPMNAQSSYHADYPKKEGTPARTSKKVFYYDPCPPPMEDRSSYGIAFVNHPPLEKDCKKTQKELQIEYGSWCCPFDGLTTYKKDYTPVMKPCPSQSMRPKSYMKDYLGKFDDRTVYRCAYEPFYYDDGKYKDCIPYLEYDNIFPPKDKCADVRCFPEVDRTPKPYQRPTPPCPPEEPPFVCPTNQQVRCGPRMACGPCGM